MKDVIAAAEEQLVKEESPLWWSSMSMQETDCYGELTHTEWYESCLVKGSLGQAFEHVIIEIKWGSDVCTGALLVLVTSACIPRHTRHRMSTQIWWGCCGRYHLEALSSTCRCKISKIWRQCVHHCFITGNWRLRCKDCSVVRPPAHSDSCQHNDTKSCRASLHSSCTVSFPCF